MFSSSRPLHLGRSRVHVCPGPLLPVLWCRSRAQHVCTRHAKQPSAPCCVVGQIRFLIGVMAKLSESSPCSDVDMSRKRESSVQRGAEPAGGRGHGVSRRVPACGVGPLRTGRSLSVCLCHGSWSGALRREPCKRVSFVERGVIPDLTVATGAGREQGSLRESARESWSDPRNAFRKMAPTVRSFVPPEACLPGSTGAASSREAPCIPSLFPEHAAVGTALLSYVAPSP